MRHTQLQYMFSRICLNSFALEVFVNIFSYITVLGSLCLCSTDILMIDIMIFVPSRFPFYWS